MNEQETKAQCSKCLNWIINCGNTSNFSNHLFSAHRIRNKSLSTPSAASASSSQSMDTESLGESSRRSPVSSQMTIDEGFEYINSLRDSGHRSEMYTNAITTWMAKDMVAANIVTGEGFIKMFQLITPRYKVPCPNTIKNRIDRKFVGAKSLIVQKLKEFSSIALTADCWTHQYTNNQYLGITAHGFNGRSIESYTIACLKFTETHTADNLHQILVDGIMGNRERENSCLCH